MLTMLRNLETNVKAVNSEEKRVREIDSTLSKCTWAPEKVNFLCNQRKQSESKIKNLELQNRMDWENIRQTLCNAKCPDDLIEKFEAHYLKGRGWDFIGDSYRKEMERLATRLIMLPPKRGE